MIDLRGTPSLYWEGDILEYKNITQYLKNRNLLNFNFSLSDSPKGKRINGYFGLVLIEYWCLHGPVYLELEEGLFLIIENTIFNPEIKPFKARRQSLINILDTLLDDEQFSLAYKEAEWFCSVLKNLNVNNYTQIGTEVALTLTLKQSIKIQEFLQKHEILIRRNNGTLYFNFIYNYDTKLNYKLDISKLAITVYNLINNIDYLINNIDYFPVIL